jgi:hypothetical protein
MLSPEDMAKAQSTGGINPALFLTAAADLHNSGQLSQPSGPTSDPLASAYKKNMGVKKRIRLIK